MSKLRERMIGDMELAGLSAGTQQVYLYAVRALAKFYMKSPDQLTERQVVDYILFLRDEKKIARGTFRTQYFAIKFLYVVTLGCEWPLFVQKKFANRAKSDCPLRNLTTTAVA